MHNNSYGIQTQKYTYNVKYKNTIILIEDTKHIENVHMLQLCTVESRLTRSQPNEWKDCGYTMLTHCRVVRPTLEGGTY